MGGYDFLITRVDHLDHLIIHLKTVKQQLLSLFSENIVRRVFYSNWSHVYSHLYDENQISFIV